MLTLIERNYWKVDREAAAGSVKSDRLYDIKEENHLQVGMVEEKKG